MGGGVKRLPGWFGALFCPNPNEKVLVLGGDGKIGSKKVPRGARFTEGGAQNYLGNAHIHGPLFKNSLPLHPSFESLHFVNMHKF